MRAGAFSSRETPSGRALTFVVRCSGKIFVTVRFGEDRSVARWMLMMFPTQDLLEMGLLEKVRAVREVRRAPQS